MATTRFRYSRTFPATPDDAFDWLVPVPLEQVFTRRYGPIAPVVQTKADDAASWGAVGQRRTIRMSDGSTMREELTRVDRPQALGYRISDVTGTLKLTIGGADGLWEFTPAGTGVRITWTWDVEPASTYAEWLMPAVRRLWTGTARQVFDEIESGLIG